LDGGESGGRAFIEITYSAEKNAKLRLKVNGSDYTYINAVATGSWHDYTGRTGLTVSLMSGRENRILLSGGNGGVNIDCLRITRFGESGKLGSKIQAAK
jgi:hypothetical protein